MLKFLRENKSKFTKILMDFISIVFVKSEPIISFKPEIQSRSVASSQSLWRLHMETLPSLLAPCEGNPRVTTVFLLLVWTRFKKNRFIQDCNCNACDHLIWIAF